MYIDAYILSSLCLCLCLFLSLYTRTYLYLYISARSLTSWRWKMPAARPASALVAANMDVKCAGEPAPDEAITGMLTHFFMCAISTVS